MSQLSNDYLTQFLDSTKEIEFERFIQNLNLNKNKISFDFAVSSVYSSNIEGNTMDINSYFNYDLRSKINREKREIDELILAYNFAKENELNYDNLLEAHRILSLSFLDEFQQGTIRNSPVGVFGSSGLIYMALEADKVEVELKKLMDEVTELLSRELSIQEVFYYASFLHLRIAHIHPFADGNGRIARLVEKWFLAQKLGIISWKIKSEQYYKENQKEYYTNINIGPNFYELDYSQSIPFLLMLAKSFEL